MNCKSLKNIRKIFTKLSVKSTLLSAFFLKRKNKITSLLIVFFAITLAFFGFYTLKLKSQSLPDCSIINSDPIPGENCLYFGKPLCSVLGKTQTPNPRTNCADIIDLPLCDQIDNQLRAFPGKNCVKECRDSSFDSLKPDSETGLVRGIDYAIHNKNCIRFCDKIESGVPNFEGNCIGRKCHHFFSQDDFDPKQNCKLLNCNLLTPDELNETKFSDSSKKFCEGDNLKCYKFIKEQLPYLKIRKKNTMCTIHDCRPKYLGCKEDDTQNITKQGENYENYYVKYINNSLPLESDLSPCNQLSKCIPPVKNQYRCLPFDNKNPSERNSECDTSGDGSKCLDGYCYKTIDCNNLSNELRYKYGCLGADETKIIDVPDDTESWFYRPKPMDKATSGSGVLRKMNPELCYSKDQLEENGWGWDGKVKIGDLVIIDGGFAHSIFQPDRTRSPGLCEDDLLLGTNRDRGSGYLYLCGNRGSLYKKIYEHSAYYEGYVKSDFSKAYPNHTVRVCLRFKNLGRPDDATQDPSETCGKRECAISCSFGVCSSQSCGSDICYDLQVNDKNPKECEMNDAMFKNETGNDEGADNDRYHDSSDPKWNKKCLIRIDNYLRLRAVKMENSRKICTFLDVKGQLAYDGDLFFDGTEKVNGEDVSSSHKNTRDDPGAAHKWRTVMMVPYIQNNRPSGEKRGYIDKDGKLFPEQDCPMTGLRLGTPTLYNLATNYNSPDLLIPSLYILNVMREKNGTISIGQDGGYGDTDFNYPEIEVQFGSSTKKMNLEIGANGYGSSSNLTDIKTNFGTKEYTVSIFTRKGYDQDSKQPIFCLYKQVKDENGKQFDSIVGCVKRTLPEIDNYRDRVISNLIKPKILIIRPHPDNTFNNSRILFRYLGNFGGNGKNDKCQNDDSCSSEQELGPNLDIMNNDLSACLSSNEEYKICAKREYCSQLNIECVENEIKIQNSAPKDKNMESYLSVRNRCVQNILPRCNAKKGIKSSDENNMFNQDPNLPPEDPKLYGWFNELCIVSGFETKLKNVVAHKVPGNIGKCIIDSSSPYLKDNDQNTNCDSGGRYPNCLCIEASEEQQVNDKEEIRKQTAREAGLCIDMKLPDVCRPITYNSSNLKNPMDPYYVYSSLNNDKYSNLENGVDFSHKYRTEQQLPGSLKLVSGHGEFGLAFIGMKDVLGECRGFWKTSFDNKGIELKPKMSCLNINGKIGWHRYFFIILIIKTSLPIFFSQN